MRAEPVEEDLSPFFQGQATHGIVHTEREHHEPTEKANSIGHHRKRSDDETRGRAVVIVVVVLRRVEVIQRQLLDGVPEDSTEDEEIIVAVRRDLREPCDHSQERPQAKERAGIREERLVEEGLQLSAQAKKRLILSHDA